MLVIIRKSVDNFGTEGIKMLTFESAVALGEMKCRNNR